MRRRAGAGEKEQAGRRPAIRRGEDRGRPPRGGAAGERAMGEASCLGEGGHGGGGEVEGEGDELAEVVVAGEG